MKKLTQSKTFWKAVIVGVSGILIAALTELDLIGYIAFVNAIVDIALRVVTTEEVKV